MRRRFADEWVVSQHAHIKRLRAHGYFAPDSSEAHKPERFPAHFGSRCGGFFPAPLVDSSVQPRHLPRKRQKQSEGMLGHAHGVSAGRAHHQHAALRGCFQINIVHADASAAHRAQLRGPGEQMLGDFRRAAHDQCIGIGNFRFERLFCGQDGRPAVLLLQQFHASLTDLVRDDDFHSAPSVAQLDPYPLENGYEFATRHKKSKVASPFGSVNSVQTLRTQPSAGICLVSLPGLGSLLY